MYISQFTCSLAWYASWTDYTDCTGPIYYGIIMSLSYENNVLVFMVLLILSWNYPLFLQVHTPLPVIRLVAQNVPLKGTTAYFYNANRCLLKPEHLMVDHVSPPVLSLSVSDSSVVIGAAQIFGTQPNWHQKIWQQMFDKWLIYSSRGGDFTNTFFVTTPLFIFFFW